MSFSDTAFFTPKDPPYFNSEQRMPSTTSAYSTLPKAPHESSTWESNTNAQTAAQNHEPAITPQRYPPHSVSPLPYPSTSTSTLKDPYSRGAGLGGGQSAAMGGFPASSFNYAGNLRDTRPMTAPATSTLYFSNTIYSPSPHHPYGTSAFYPADHNATFNYQVDSGSSRPESDEFGTRGFSSLETVGTSGSLAVSPLFNSAMGAVEEDQLGGQEDDSSNFSSTEGSEEPSSRPNTGDSSSRTRRNGMESRASRQRARSDVPLRASNPYNETNETARQRFDDDSRVYSLMNQRSSSKASKRPRRRFDEIERLYTCDYPECPKAYGTLNHLNSHKTMQKHGPKSTPARKRVSRAPASRWSTVADTLPSFLGFLEFKDLRKAWRDRKKAAATAALAPPSRILFEGSRPNPPLDIYNRPRLHTSAGEYRYQPPAPPYFPPSYDHAGSTYSFQQSLAHPTPHHQQPHERQQQYAPSPQFSFDVLHSTIPYTESPISSHDHQPQYRSVPVNYPRPVTAPSYYPGPSFGQQPGGPFGPASSRNSGGSNGEGVAGRLSPQGSLGGIAGRRMSLPLGTEPSLLNPVEMFSSIEEEEPGIVYGSAGRIGAMD